MGSCAAPSAKGDDKFITTDYLQQCHKPCLSPPALPRQEVRHLNHYLWRLCHETINYLRNRRVCKASA
ncbi:hypothetical protein EHH34_21560 [Salmonella enterica subsp. enterica serovar Infantis]|nr:hypothetical protein [Salmonella enterica subsp. enterica serovar Infantis]